MAAGWKGVIEEYRSLLPIGPDTPVVTLLEGGTPLVPAPRLSARMGADVWLKVEGANPTGSFKDRGMTMAISMAVEEGAKAVVCASTGNTSASAAAYAARAGLACVVLIPEGHIALGKLAQAPGPRRARVAGTGELRSAFDHRSGTALARADHRGELRESPSHRRAEDGRVRNCGRFGRCPRTFTAYPSAMPGI